MAVDEQSIDLDVLWSKLGTVTSEEDKHYQTINLLAALLCQYHHGGDITKKCLMELRFIKQLANLVTLEFMKAVDQQCSLCEENEEALVNFLKSGNGVVLLISLCLLSEKITSCREELCKLLVSILPLTTKASKCEDSHCNVLLVSATDLLLNSRAFDIWREKLKNLLISSSKDCFEPQVSFFADSKSSFKKCFMLSNERLFLAIYLALLNLSLSQFQNKEYNLHNFLVKQVYEVAFDKIGNRENMLTVLKPDICQYVILFCFASSMHLFSTVQDGETVVSSISFLTDCVTSALTLITTSNDINPDYDVRSGEVSAELLMATFCAILWCFQSRESNPRYFTVSQLLYDAGIYKALHKLVSFLEQIIAKGSKAGQVYIKNIEQRAGSDTVSDIAKRRQVLASKVLKIVQRLFSCLVRISERIKRSKKSCRGISGISEQARNVKRRGGSYFKHNYTTFAKKGESRKGLGSRNGKQETDSSADGQLSSSSTGDMSDFITKSEDGVEFENIATRRKITRKRDSMKISEKELTYPCTVSLVCHTFLDVYQVSECDTIQEIILDSLVAVDFCECMDPDGVATRLLIRLEQRPTSVRNKALSILNRVLRAETSMLGLNLAPNNVPYCRQGGQRLDDNVPEPALPEDSGHVSGLSQCSSVEEDLIARDPFIKSPDSIFCAYHSYLTCQDISVQNDVTQHLSLLVPSVDDSIQSKILTKVLLPYLQVTKPEHRDEASALPLLNQSTAYACMHLLPHFLSSPQNLRLFSEYDGLGCLQYAVEDERYGQAALSVLKWLVCNKELTVATDAVKLKQRWKDSRESPHFQAGRDRKHLKLARDMQEKACDILLSSLHKMFTWFSENEYEKLYELEGTQLFYLHLKTSSAMLYSSEHYRSHFIDQAWPLKCFCLFRRMVTLAKSEEEINVNVMLMILNFTEALLPIILQFSAKFHGDNEYYLTTREALLAQTEDAFLSESVFKRSYITRVVDMIFHCSLEYCEDRCDEKDRDRNRFKPKMAVEKISVEDEDEDLSDFGLAEEEYDADSETESDGRSDLDLTSRSIKSRSISDDVEILSTPFSEKPLITSPDLLILCLQALANYVEKNFNCELKRCVTITQRTFELVLTHMVGNAENCVILCQQGLLLLLVSKFKSMFQKFGEHGNEMQNCFCKIIVLLCQSSVTGNELRAFLQLFECQNAATEFLARTLMNMAKAANISYGSSYCLSFPVNINEGIQKDRANVPALHKAHSFLVPRKSAYQQGRSVIRYRSVSWANKFDISETDLSPLSSELHPSAWEIAAVQLELEGRFLWPDREFSLSLWFQLSDRTVITRHTQDIAFGVRTSRSKSFSHKWKTCQDFGLSTLLHLCSFGSINAFFEVWLGSRTGHLEYRWIVADSVQGESSLNCFDQVLLRSAFSRNKWHHLYISLIMPQKTSQPHSAEICTFVDGCKQTTVQVKFPSQKASSQANLHTLIGHGIREGKGKISSSDVVLKTGNLLVFTGPESILNTTKTSKLSSRKQSSVAACRDEAIFLYALGPNDSLVSGNPQGYLSSQTTRHMDSSLNWESMLFRDMSFSLGILSEHLVSADFPIHLLIDTSKHIPYIQSSLQECLLLAYCPQRFSEFIQYSSGNVVTSRFSRSTDDLRSGLVRQPKKVLVTLCADVTSWKHNTLQQATHDVGGMSVLFFLLAKVGEHIDSGTSVACILDAIFCVQERCPYLIREMNDLTGYILIQRVLHSSPSDVGFHLLQVLITCMCDGEVFVSNETCSADAVKPNSTAIVKNVCILQVLILDWKLWERAPVALQELLWRSLEVLIRPSHPHYAFNVIQFQRASVIDRILTGCQERQQEKLMALPETVSSMYIRIINHMLGMPPDMSVLKGIISFLIAVHPTLDALKLHSPGNFYILPRFSEQMESSLEKDNALAVLSSQVLPVHTRSRSYTEDCSKTDRGLSRSGSNESIVSILVSDGGSSSEDKAGHKSFLPKFPRSEVVFQKRQRFHTLERQVSLISNNAVESELLDDSERKLSVPGTKVELATITNIKAHSTPKTKQTTTSDSEFRSESSFGSDIECSAVDMFDASSHGVTRKARLKHQSHRLSIRHKRNRSLDVNLRLAVASQNAAPDSQEYDIISDSELPSSLEQHDTDEFLVVDGMTALRVSSFTPSGNSSTSTEEVNMLYHLRLGLLELLQNVITLLPDHLVPRVFGTILKVEHLLVLVSQEEENLREVAVKNLCLYLQRGGQDCLNNFKRFMGFHLLANQLHQHRATAEIANSCFSLLIGSSPLTKHEQIQKLDVTTECSDAIVACMSLLEMSCLDPPVCHLLVTVMIKAFNNIDNLPIVAFEYGMAPIFVNTVKMLVAADSFSLTSEWKTDVFADLLALGSWIVKKACCTCQTLYFQMYKDLILYLQSLESEERDRKGKQSYVLARVARFLQYYFVQVALNVFRTTDLYVTHSRFGKKSVPTVISDSAEGSGQSMSLPKRSSSVAKAIFQRLRASIVPPTIATPAEIQERFQYLCHEAVSLVCLASKIKQSSGIILYGHVLKDLSLPPVSADLDEVDFGSKSSEDCDSYFRRGILSFILDAVCLCLDQTVVVSSWTALLKATKDDVLGQANRLVTYLISPLNNYDVRLATLNEILLRKQFKNILHGLQHSSLGAKNRDRLLMCLHSVLVIRLDVLSDEQIGIQQEGKQLLKASKLDIIESTEQQLWQEMQELKLQRRKRQKEIQKEAYERLKTKFNGLCSRIITHGLGVSQVLVDEQDRQRQKLLRYVRGTFSKHVEVKKVWRNLIHHLVQERSPWFVHELNPTSWQLDPTEGPCRIRKRLQRCHLDIPKRFFLDKAQKCHEAQDKSGGILSYLFEEDMSGDKPTYYHFKTNDTIRFLYHCVRVTPAENTSGEVLIGETHMYFVGEEILTDQNITQVAFGDKDVISISWRYEEIGEILKRRYCLQNNALEIFLTSGRTFLLSFESEKSRDEVYDQLMSRELPNLVTNSVDLATLSGRWRDGLITNFEYLTELNKKAGRSFNDLMQYPVFPFILADYSSDALSLTDPNCFRDLSKPIAVQHPSKEEKYQETYNWLKVEYERRMEEDPELATPPYHYGSHYSNSGTVLHFLVRLPPFTSMFLKYQDNQFDIPDRTFHSMSTTWHLSSYASSSDVKELIPEFFFLEEFLENSEGFNFGRRQNGVQVDNVGLPPWAKGSARLFTLVHRQALESDHVSASLNSWIDLVFGVKQTGAAAIKAFNVFHPATYFGVDVNAINDPIKRRATQTMIETYGQTPYQLFISPHVKRFSKSALSDMLPLGVEAMMLYGGFREKPMSSDSKPISGVPSPLSSVSGLKWGKYCGSPALSDPVLQWVQTAESQVSSIVSSTDGLLAFVLPASSSLIMAEDGFRDNRHIGCIQWGRGDGLLRINTVSTSRCGFFDPLRPDKVTCCEYVSGAEVLLVGGSSGVLSAWPVKYNGDVPSLEVMGAKQNLLGHTKAISTIWVCQAFSVIVTCSDDRTAIIWDLNRLCYVRSFPVHPSPIQCVTVSNTTGDIATACAAGNKQSRLFLWTINSKPVGDVETDAMIRCLGFSSAPEGISVNVIAAGLSDGSIRLWSTWTLDLLRNFSSIHYQSPVVCVTYSEWDPRHLFSCDARGNILLWTPKDFTLQKPATFVSLID